MRYKVWLAAAALIACLGVGIGWSYYSALTDVVVSVPVTVEVVKGDSFTRIIEKLQAQQVPINGLWFKLLALPGDGYKRVKTGEYELPAGLTQPDILALLLAGKTKRYAITIPEGWNFSQLRRAVEQNPHLEHTLNGLEPVALMAKLGVTATHPEGAFFPDTYFFEKHTSDVALLQRAYLKMQQVIAREWPHKAEQLPYKNAYEALIMASIIEKETAAEPERPQIAGVFVRRLQQGMRLQTDPTVIYGLGAAYQGDITYKDLKTLTPYNTYLITGLPPTPIAMPGLAAIKAALHPDTSASLYFVARGDGTHVFSANLAAHNQAVNQYQRKSK